MGTPLVTVTSPDRQDFTLSVDQRLDLGRECDGVVIVDARVSRRHLTIEPGPDGTLLVNDLDSANGTTVDGVAVTGPTRAKPGAEIRIGDTRLIVGASAGSGAPGGGRATVIAPSGPRSTIDDVAEAVVDDLRANVLDVDRESGTLTVVFSDIERSTQLAVALGDATWFDVLQRHGRLVEAHVGAHRGRIVKHQGDGYMLCFRSARSALLAAIGIQRDLTGGAWSQPGQELRVRMGMHIGESIVDDAGDLFGKHVVIAARIGALASGGEILVSSLVRQIAESRGDMVFLDPQEVELRGIEGVETVHRVDWSGFSSESP